MAILPKSADFDNEHIVDKLSFPTVVFLLNQRYFNVETNGAFMDTLRSHNGHGKALPHPRLNDSGYASTAGGSSA